jgi:MerR family transcriptional regulator, light-induced transcriptional regulator
MTSLPGLWNKLSHRSGQQLGRSTHVEVSVSGHTKIMVAEGFEQLSNVTRAGQLKFPLEGRNAKRRLSWGRERKAAVSDLSRQPDTELSCWSDTHPGQEARQGRRPKSRAAAEAEARVARLTRTIEAEIIPRLLLANSQAPEPHAVARGRRQIGAADIDALVATLLEQDTASAVRLFEQLESEGVARETLFLDLLTPAARKLGDAWLDDTLSFAAVTIGLAGLQQLLRHLSPQFEDRAGLKPHGRQALLFTAPSEQHSFGLFMVEAFFRRTAWDVTNASTIPITDITALVRRNWFDVVGISKSSDALLGDLASDITRLRRASRNRNLTVLVGGPVFIGRPELVVQVGADATGIDARQAVWQATKCVMALSKA